MTEHFTLGFVDRTSHTALFECNLDVSGYVILNLPVAHWKELGCPKEIIFSVTPVIAPEQMEAMIA